MRKILMGAVLMMLTGWGAAAMAQDGTGAWLKSSYLASIHDDCRVFLEGIELFTQRDYPVFLQNMQKGSVVARADAAAYISELKNFEKLLDSLYEEYISFKKASLTVAGGVQPSATGLSEVEQRLFQMLAYAYLRTGDFAMARMLIMNHDMLSSDFTIKIRNIEGQLVDFQLTRQLKERFKETNTILTTLTVHFKNFSATDIPEDINAYIKVSGYDRKEPANTLFMEYYGRLFPGLNSKGDKDNLIHVGQIIKFFNIQKYRHNLLSGTDARESQGGYDTTYTFPMVKGTYELVVRDPTISATAISDNVITVERLCLFKGLARTDFRALKEEQRLQKELDMIVAEEITLMQPGQKYLSYKPGQMVPYGTYALFEKNRHLGTLELIPCYRGGKCREPVNRDPGVTPVRIFDHTFVLYRDVLDLVRQSQATKSAMEFKAAQQQREVHLFPGCAPAAQE